MSDLCPGSIPFVYLCNRIVDSYPDIKHDNMDEKKMDTIVRKENILVLLLL